jgi:hypothetical protein
MPITVASCFASAGLAPTKVVPWRESLRERNPGVYVLSLTSEKDASTPAIASAPIDIVEIERLMLSRPHLQLDRKQTTSSLLALRLSCYWLPTEPILYIGQTSKPLQSRLQEFYRTPIGARAPHAGGWWVKALTCLSDVYVHYAPTDTFEESERKMLRYFVANADVPQHAERPHDGMPFANKEWWTETSRRIRRNHGIRHATSNPNGKKCKTLLR